ncbi:putative secreted trypsin-like serine protease [Corynebacterium kutscheri]|uniref:Trypsin n=1 Tax=Corynebacterium kutscheri TaxID=35755 RepID=A0A0F6TDY7_9CORY|nr:trypsin-like serine protease [Corynebacterium kutscheri]AKE41626.1 Trypsin [Corynebacterium kutscheri]VEH08901.1 putative secreted trypsin-like serine protease [Corynebacterium kutscheri]VEH09952.1 putative secreted trypsin-like serine protease [Corynebacterium kutscheri]VEH80031.1 putative secreted trypsin-like serine protease [Corynebacterium kutscheri]
MEIAKTSLISLACVFVALWSFPAAAKEIDNDFVSLRASSTVPVNDNRIAALWSVIPGLDDIQESRIRRDCTASYLGDNFWLTAHHCVSNSPFMDGFLRQSDGEIAGIAAIYTKSLADDVALIKVGEGINADVFALTNESLKIGDEAVLTGYGQPHDYASSALTVISEKVDSLSFGNVTYTDLFKGTASTDSRSCGGDSGAPVYKAETLYAVHTAGGFNPECSGGQNRLMWHTNLVPRLPWIKETIENNSGLTYQEKSKATTGLKHAAILFPNVDKPQGSHDNSSPNKSSSNLFSLSSTQPSQSLSRQ